ncbi:hypothetical protein BDN70DRAFT_931577 [Pholiota conissans]|uniref:Heterokaryon incompatibility domain-containing protein n=1 Tax=Pholiota conissans TaxID=109636 RepID=A0A9P5Z4K3_9AGAR|nr:hypothetical protein BDN70DRAFT_931577 [Pholiota conissans]
MLLGNSRNADAVSTGLDTHTANSASLADQGPLLLQALQAYLLPLISTANRQNNSSVQTAQSPEAEKFLAVFQDFVSYIVRSQSNTSQDGIEVEMKDAGDHTKITHFSSLSSTADLTQEKDNDTLKPKPLRLKKIHEELRMRVFNEMPIRLLHIVPHECKLRIRLLERGQVYTQLAKQIEEEYSDSKFFARLEQERVTSGETQRATLERNVIKHWVSAHASYAILSHTWIRSLGGEVTYNDHRSGLGSNKAGFKKLVNFCRVTAVKHKLSLGWMDSLCINKESSSELDESIRSMYRWYKNSSVCITYLAETTDLSMMHQDPWFTRGWTLQELLAPDILQFYNSTWEPFNKTIGANDKDETAFQAQIQKATMITASELDLPGNMPISRIMQLAARREVVREEDTAYSLMGICGVSISIAYGEGYKIAFTRLLTAILNTSRSILDIFNCAQNRYSLLPSSPWAYVPRSTKLKGLNWQRPIEPLLLTHLGLKIPVLLMSSVQADDPNYQNSPIGDYYGTVNFPKPWYSKYTGHYCLLDKGATVAPKQHDAYHTTFGIINFGLGEDKAMLEIPDTCLAVNFQSHWNVEWDPPARSIKRLGTQQPIVFELISKKNPSSFHLIKRSELAEHGIILVNMYL